MRPRTLAQGGSTVSWKVRGLARGVAAPWLGLVLLSGCSSAREAPRDHTAAPDPAGTSLTLAAPTPVQTASDFTREHPHSRVIAAADGQRLTHASGFSFDTGATQPQEAVSRFIARYGTAFGVTERQTLSVRGPASPAEVGTVRLERRIDGMPVFGADLVLGVTRGRVFLVNTADVPPTVAGGHKIGEERARTLAVAAVGGGARGTSQVAVAPGWSAVAGSVRAVYRVDFAAQEPPGDWRVFVDGESGAILFVEDRRVHASAPGKVFEVSPVEADSGFCPLADTGGHTDCEAPVDVTFDNLATGADLAGTQTDVKNCKGGNAPADKTQLATACATVAPSGGRFDFPVDATGASPADDFSAAMAYFHLDRHVSFFKTLDPTLPGAAQDPPSAALNGSLPALVNVMQNGDPLENAAYSPLLDAMLFGQGAKADYAYDATVMYHEFTHGVVNAWGGFNLGIDSMGGVDEPAAVNEGTADAMAVSETGRSAIGAYIGSVSGEPALRDVSDPTASRTCRGDGTTGTVFGLDGVVLGLDGEAHDDGQIWNGFYWEVFDGLRTAGLKGCNGACEAGPALQYLALRLAAGTSPKLGDYWQTMKSAATTLFPDKPEVATYVDCVAKRRKLDQCDRTVPVYGGETRLQYVRLRYSPFQLAITATGAGEIDFCSLHGTTTTVHARKGKPVELASIDAFGNATITSDVQFTMSQACNQGTSPATFESGDEGTWYFLFDAPDAFPTSPPGFDIFKVTAGATGIATRPAPATPDSCTPPTVTQTGDPGSSPGTGGTDGTSGTSSSGCTSGPGGAGVVSVLVAVAAAWRARPPSRGPRRG